MKKTLLIITAIIFTTSFTFGQHKWQKRFSKNSKPYRSEITYNFIASCIEGGAEVDYCSCLFDYIVNNMKEVTPKSIVDSIAAELNWGAEKLRDDITCLALNLENTELIKKEKKIIKKS